MTFGVDYAVSNWGSGMLGGTVDNSDKRFLFVVQLQFCLQIHHVSMCIGLGRCTLQLRWWCSGWKKADGIFHSSGAAWSGVRLAASVRQACASFTVWFWLRDDDYTKTRNVMHSRNCTLQTKHRMEWHASILSLSLIDQCWWLCWVASRLMFSFINLIADLFEVFHGMQLF